MTGFTQTRSIKPPKVVVATRLRSTVGVDPLWPLVTVSVERSWRAAEMNDTDSGDELLIAGDSVACGGDAVCLNTTAVGVNDLERMSVMS